MFFLACTRWLKDRKTERASAVADTGGVRMGRGGVRNEANLTWPSGELYPSTKQW